MWVQKFLALLENPVIWLANHWLSRKGKFQLKTLMESPRVTHSNCLFHAPTTIIIIIITHVNATVSVYCIALEPPDRTQSPSQNSRFYNNNFCLVNDPKHTDGGIFRAFAVTWILAKGRPRAGKNTLSQQRQNLGDLFPKKVKFSNSWILHSSSGRLSLKWFSKERVSHISTGLYSYKKLHHHSHIYVCYIKSRIWLFQLATKKPQFSRLQRRERT